MKPRRPKQIYRGPKRTYHAERDDTDDFDVAQDRVEFNRDRPRATGGTEGNHGKSMRTFEEQRRVKFLAASRAYDERKATVATWDRLRVSWVYYAPWWANE